MPDMLRCENAGTALELELLHQLFTNGPHTHPFAVDVHGYGGQETSELDPT